MWTAAVLAAAVVSATAQAPAKTKPRPTDFAGAGVWGRSDLSAVEIARRADRALAGLNATTAETTMNVQLGRDSGRAISDLKIARPNLFNLEVVRWEDGTPKSAIVRRVGDRRALFLGLLPNSETQYHGVRGWVPINAQSPWFSPTGAGLVRQWPMNFGYLVYGSLAAGTPTLERLAKAYGAGAEGYTLQAQRTVNRINGQARPQYRLLAVRSGAAATRRGPSRIEIRIDGTRWLPVTVLIDHRPKGGAALNVNWSAAWRFQQLIDTVGFTIPTR